MIDISNKIETLRSAVAESRVIAKKDTIDRAVRGETPKGDVLNVAKAAACLAAKKTAELIPYCHPLAIDAVTVTFEPKDREMTVRAEVKTVGKTGVEMEALTAASVAALTIYDMLKGIDKDVVIGETRLLEKHGGKSDFAETFLTPLSAAVLVTSDSVASGKKSDKSGKIIVEEMKRFPVEVLHYEIVPDEKEKIRQKLLGWVEEGIRLIVTTGGTGLGPRDVTVEAAREIIERDVPGIAEAMRSYGQRRTPYAMLSRGVVGVRGKTLIITLPGSSNGVKEGIAAIFPNVLHSFNMMGGGGH
jgi:molybdenum cofactor biosynthesis protein MoaC